MLSLLALILALISLRFFCLSYPFVWKVVLEVGQSLKIKKFDIYGYFY